MSLCPCTVVYATQPIFTTCNTCLTSSVPFLWYACSSLRNKDNEADDEVPDAEGADKRTPMFIRLEKGRRGDTKGHGFDKIYRENVQSSWVGQVV